jgi:hypothetical protein
MGVTADGRASAWLPLLAQAARVQSTFSRMLRLNPAARSTLPSPESEPAPPVSYYEKMRLLEGRRDEEHH